MMAEVMTRTAKMVAMWQVYGFTHGVMNTDNMSINGLTIDYGPFGFMEYFDSYYIPNSSDKWGRYAYKPQPKIAGWNLKKLYLGIKKTVGPETYGKILDNHDKFYWRTYNNFYYSIMADKLGFIGAAIAEKPEFRDLVSNFFDSTMDYCRTDMTLGFKTLERFNLNNSKEIIGRLVGLSPPKENLMASYRPKDNFLEGKAWQEKVGVIRMTWKIPSRFRRCWVSTRQSTSKIFWTMSKGWGNWKNWMSPPSEMIFLQRNGNNGFRAIADF